MHIYRGIDRAGATQSELCVVPKEEASLVPKLKSLFPGHVEGADNPAQSPPKDVYSPGSWANTSTAQNAPATKQCNGYCRFTWR